jgi:hypothetical protein
MVAAAIFAAGWRKTKFWEMTCHHLCADFTVAQTAGQEISFGLEHEV